MICLMCRSVDMLIGSHWNFYVIQVGNTYIIHYSSRSVNSAQRYACRYAADSYTITESAGKCRRFQLDYLSISHAFLLPCYLSKSKTTPEAIARIAMMISFPSNWMLKMENSPVAISQMLRRTMPRFLVIFICLLSLEYSNR